MTFCTVQSAAGHEKQGCCIVTQQSRTVEAKNQTNTLSHFMKTPQAHPFCSLQSCLPLFYAVSSRVYHIWNFAAPLGRPSEPRTSHFRAPWMIPSENCAPQLLHCFSGVSTTCSFPGVVAEFANLLDFLFENMLGRNRFKIWMLYIVYFVFFKVFFQYTVNVIFKISL